MKLSVFTLQACGAALCVVLLHRERFHCNTGRCLSPTLVCDGYDDCGDLSDELNCVCDLSREHRCGDGRCVSRDWMCDGDHDCLDKTDELNCSCKSQGLLECRNGHCIPSAFRCDGEDDCKDGSDEEHAAESRVRRLSGQPVSDVLACHPSNTCLSASQGVVSPGQPSCISTSCPSVLRGAAPPVTRNNTTTTTTALPNYLGHLSQRESSVSWESSLFPALVQTGCYQYSCSTPAPCWSPSVTRSVCRGSHPAVARGLGLQPVPEEGGKLHLLLPEAGVDECSPSHFKCRSGRCVLASKRCDGHLDCDDHSDEDNCAVCSDNELSCNNHQCVHRTLWCDGKKHCSDSSTSGTASGSVLTVFRTAAESIRSVRTRFRPPFPWYPTNLESRAVAVGYTSTLSGTEERFCSQGRLEGEEKSCVSLQEESVCPLYQRRVWSRPACETLPHRKKRILGGRVSRRGAGWPWQCSLQSGQSGHVCGCVLMPGGGRAPTCGRWCWVSNLDHRASTVRAAACAPSSYTRATTGRGGGDGVRPASVSPSAWTAALPRLLRYITGWGHMGNRMPFKLQEGEVRIISLSQCQSYFDMKTITPRMLCAGRQWRPLVCEEDGGRWTFVRPDVMGSVCFSKVLGPGVYSNVTHFTPWIQQQIYIHTYLND
ncbi:hypothetical protein INR49_001165 [Caranx melampygus]|nr:hypothetical protein INR49_001165 [Caranx melampygus]